MLPGEIKELLLDIIREYTGGQVDIRRTSPVGGGCINDAHRVDTQDAAYFVKYNSASRYPGMFESEARGLKLLAEAGTLKVPKVIGFGEAGRLMVAAGEQAGAKASSKQNNYSILVLEYIEAAPQPGDFYEAFGEGLAAMHQQRSGGGRKGFGLDHDNYIGSLPQSNKPHNDWIEFFITERLEKQLKLARDGGKADRGFARMFEAMYRHLPDFFPEEPPALLHGDLWSGNYMTGEAGQAVIIDPAVYYGHRYMDLGMSKLFGGFSPAFYRAYADTYPLDASWDQSMDIANLYPLMVHVNLFGGSYPGSVQSILRRFI